VFASTDGRDLRDVEHVWLDSALGYGTIQAGINWLAFAINDVE